MKVISKRDIDLQQYSRDRTNSTIVSSDVCKPFANYAGLKLVLACHESSYMLNVCLLGVVQQWWRRCKRSLRLPMLCTLTAKQSLQLPWRLFPTSN